MDTKLITSLDQLEPGMKTKDGWEYASSVAMNAEVDSIAYWHRGDKRIIRVELTFPDTKAIFLNQEVEVPE